MTVYDLKCRLCGQEMCDYCDTSETSSEYLQRVMSDQVECIDRGCADFEVLEHDFDEVGEGV